MKADGTSEVAMKMPFDQASPRIKSGTTAIRADSRRAIPDVPQLTPCLKQRHPKAEFALGSPEV